MAVNALYKFEFGVEPESELALSEAIESEALEELRDAAAYLDAVRAAMVPRFAASSDPAYASATPLDADGDPIVVGAFYVGSTCGPCLSVHLNGSVVIGAMVLTYTRQLRRAVATVIRCVSSDFGVRTYEVANSTRFWRGRLTDEQASAVINEAGGGARRRAEPVRQATRDYPPIAPTKPPVRCGQRWRLDGVEVELYDRFPRKFVARSWDGVRVDVCGDDLRERGVFISGPTVDETHAEAVRRVVDIEARNPPDGMGREEWRAMLINRIGERATKNTGTVRMTAADARAEVAEKWRRFGGGR